MPTIRSNAAQNPSVQSAQAGQTVTVRSTYELLAADSEDSAMILGMCRLPAQHRIVSLTFESDDLDMGATGALDCGIEDTVQDPSDTTDLLLFFTAVDVQAAQITEYKTVAMLEFPAVDYDRFVVLSIETVSATGLVGGVAIELVTRPDLPSLEGNFSP